MSSARLSIKYTNMKRLTHLLKNRIHELALKLTILQQVIGIIRKIRKTKRLSQIIVNQHQKIIKLPLQAALRGFSKSDYIIEIIN